MFKKKKTKDEGGAEVVVNDDGDGALEKKEKGEKREKVFGRLPQETDREFRQRRVIVGWVNNVLSVCGHETITDLSEFNDGVMFAVFVEALIGVHLKVRRAHPPHCLNNISFLCFCLFVLGR